MPLPKSLRQPVRKASSSSSGNSKRNRCRICNDLDPRGHVNTLHPNDSAKEPRALLHLIIDASVLSKTKAVADKGCRFCNVLLQALDAFAPNWRKSRVRVNIEIRERKTIKINLDDEQWKGEGIEIYAGATCRAPWPTLGTAHHIPSDSGSDDSFNFIRRCIQGCLTDPKHAICRQSSTSATASPRRLLDVGRSSAPIRIIDTQGKSFQYAALSHCWGASPQFMVTKSNWAKLAVNIRFEALPPLFQDAVIITRQLGLRFLWIDSLCIIQDSVRDWEAESSKMGSIYQSSYVTISATNSGDGTVRCLGERRKPIKIPYENTAGKEFALRARKMLMQHPDLGIKGAAAKPKGPLTSRAWALQEHVLSTRVIHYTATELLFECRTAYRCECMPDSKICKTTPALIPKALAGKSSNNVWRAWQNIVEQYSKRALTVASDRLPAISGIAHQIQKHTKSDYFAGVWLENVSLDLLWQSTSESPSLTVLARDPWRAPSFSWASLDVPVTFPHLDEAERESFSSVLSLQAASITPAGLDPLGKVLEGLLTIKTLVLPAMLCSEECEGGWVYKLLIKASSAIKITPDCLLIEDQAESPKGEVVKVIRRAHPADDPLRHFNAPATCMGVARYDNMVLGLVLGASKQHAGAFERVGTFAMGSEAFRNTKQTVIRLA